MRSASKTRDSGRLSHRPAAVYLLLEKEEKLLIKHNSQEPQLHQVTCSQPGVRFLQW